MKRRVLVKDSAMLSDDYDLLECNHWVAREEPFGALERDCPHCDEKDGIVSTDNQPSVPLSELILASIRTTKHQKLQNKSLYKTSIVIWTRYDPSCMEIDRLADEAMDGNAYCSKQETEKVLDRNRDPDWDGSEFFGVDEDEEPEEHADA